MAASHEHALSDTLAATLVDHCAPLCVHPPLLTGIIRGKHQVCSGPS